MTNREMVEAVTRKLLSRLSEDIDLLKKNGVGVTVFAFTFEPGAIAYISTADRADMLRSVKEWVAAQEAGLVTDPVGERGKA